MELNHSLTNYLIELSVDGLDIPDRLDYPFQYAPCAMARKAAIHLQQRLSRTHAVDPDPGRMMGVLVVEREGQYYYLSAYSGEWKDKRCDIVFVPPIFDPFDRKSFFFQGERDLDALTVQIEKLSNSIEYARLRKQIKYEEETLNSYCQNEQKGIRQKKAQRKKIRDRWDGEMSSEQIDILNTQSKDEGIRFKKAKRWYKRKLDGLQEKVLFFENSLQSLRNERKKRSQDLQNKLFEEYKVKNSIGEQRDLLKLFEGTSQGVPPSGAGTCAAPKLFQFAFEHQLRPVCMAEFWWGKSPKSELRKKGSFYPACRGKCEPILNFMLKGLPIGSNPIYDRLIRPKKLEILYEDDFIVAVLKPPSFLSVPGREYSYSAQELLQSQLKIASITAIHRLDMATSGILLFAKDKHSLARMQELFQKQKVHKTYEAVLEHPVSMPKGRIDLPLAPDFIHRPRQKVDFYQGKKSITEYEQVRNGHNKIKFYPKTGRTHQLRIHAAHHLGLDNPILGDALYGKDSGRLHLHASAIGFIHPIFEQEIHILSPAPF